MFIDADMEKVLAVVEQDPATLLSTREEVRAYVEEAFEASPAQLGKMLEVAARAAFFR